MRKLPKSIIKQHFITWLQNHLLLRQLKKLCTLKLLLNFIFVMRYFLYFFTSYFCLNILLNNDLSIFIGDITILYSAYDLITHVSLPLKMSGLETTLYILNCSYMLIFVSK